MDGYWTGKNKWMFQRLQHLDQALTQKYVKMFKEYDQTKQKELLISFLENLIEPFGGRLFADFSLGKERSSKKGD